MSIFRAFIQHIWVPGNKFSAKKDDDYVDLTGIEDKLNQFQSEMSSPSSDANFNPFAGHGRSSGGLYNDQIEKMMEKCPNFLGVYASDETPKMMRFVHPNTKFGWISNLDSSKGKGSHWVSIVVNGTSQQPDPYSILYFDPFGESIIPNIQKDLRLVAEKVAPHQFMKLTCQGKQNKASG
jgi:hypothetical protein